jgi:hypothetical protein
MMKTLANGEDVTGIRKRIAGVTMADQRLWGSMSVGQMVCHCTDAYRCALGEVSVKPVKAPLPVPMMKWLALRAPMKWPRGVKSTPEMTQGIGGTPPAEFQADQAALLLAVDRFVAKQAEWPEHPMFRQMTHGDWMRWGHLHMDHHLRQFGR